MRRAAWGKVGNGELVAWSYCCPEGFLSPPKPRHPLSKMKTLLERGHSNCELHDLSPRVSGCLCLLTSPRTSALRPTGSSLPSLLLSSSSTLYSSSSCSSSHTEQAEANSLHSWSLRLLHPMLGPALQTRHTTACFSWVLSEPQAMSFKCRVQFIKKSFLVKVPTFAVIKTAIRSWGKFHLRIEGS